jgi:hypothetical protein
VGDGAGAGGVPGRLRHAEGDVPGGSHGGWGWVGVFLREERRTGLLLST